MNLLLHFIDRARQYTLLQLFTIYLRYLIGGAFVIAAIGMGKLSGDELRISHQGAAIETLLPIQQFFRVMATSGLYWHFIGWMQIVSGALLMTQRYARTGAIIFFGMILNIFVITVSYHFQGTPVVTGLMLLAATFLMLWDLDSFQFIFRKPVREQLITFSPAPVIDHPYWVVVGLVMLVSIVVLGIMKVTIVVELGAAFAEGLTAFVGYWLMVRHRMQVSR